MPNNKSTASSYRSNRSRCFSARNLVQMFFLCLWNRLEKGHTAEVCLNIRFLKKVENLRMFEKKIIKILFYAQNRDFSPKTCSTTLVKNQTWKVLIMRHFAMNFQIWTTVGHMVITTTGCHVIVPFVVAPNGNVFNMVTHSKWRTMLAV